MLVPYYGKIKISLAIPNQRFATALSDMARKVQWRIQDLRKEVSKFVGGVHMAALGGWRVSGPSRRVWGHAPPEKFSKISALRRVFLHSGAI